MNSRYEHALRERLLPMPEKLSFADGFRILDDAVPVEIAGCSDTETIRSAFASYWNAGAQVLIADDAVDLPMDAYKIFISEDKIRFEACSVRAISYALYTLRQMAETQRGKPGEVRYILPCCTIEDSPVCAFRGIHFCVFPETRLSRLETEIRMAAYCKFNYAVIESWGVFPFESHPEFGWKENMFPREAFRHLLDVAKECGITLIPQFNIFGHASFSRVGSAKHAVLDFHPELESLYEPGGWSYCLSNPETRKVLTDLVLELDDFFDHPPYFHIGCDEAYDFQTCAVCASSDPETLLLDHLTYFRDLFAKRKTRIVMWHDMLLTKGDSRWKDCIVCGDSRTENLYRKLPKDILIADWQYGKAPSNPEREWPTANFFRDAGFDVLMCPWMDLEGSRQIGAQIEKEKLFGLLETTWHTAYQWDFVNMFVGGASAAWCGHREAEHSRNVAFARNLRQIHRDMGITDYFDTGHTDFQVLEKTYQTR